MNLQREGGIKIRWCCERDTRVGCRGGVVFFFTHFILLNRYMHMFMCVCTIYIYNVCICVCIYEFIFECIYLGIVFRNERVFCFDIVSHVHIEKEKKVQTKKKRTATEDAIY